MEPKTLVSLSHNINFKKKMESIKTGVGVLGSYLFAFVNFTQTLTDVNLLFSAFGSLASTFLVCVKIADYFKPSNTEGGKNKEEN